MEYKKQGMSAIVTMMIIIALALVAVGVLWYVYQNVLEGAQEEVEQGATDVFAVCTDVGTITTEDGTCEGGEIRIIGGEYCCII